MLEKFEEALHKQENPTGQKLYEPTLKDILVKKEDSDLFGEMLKREGKTDLATRMAKGELSELDIHDLDGERKSFLATMEKVKTVKESISDDVIDTYARHNPELQKVVSLIGVKEYRDIVKDKLSTLSISDPDAFEALAASVARKNEYRDEGYYKQIDTEIIELCKEKGIKDSGKYFEALLIQDEKEKEKAIRAVVREGYSWFGKSIDWTTGGLSSWFDRKALLRKEDDIKFVTEEMRGFQSDVGSFLFALTDNEIIRDAVAKEVIGDKQTPTAFEGFSTNKGAQPTKEKLQSEWTKYKGMVKDWDTMSPIDQDSQRDAFLDTQKKMYEQMQNGKTGFWASVFGSFFDLFNTINKAELK